MMMVMDFVIMMADGIEPDRTNSFAIMLTVSMEPPRAP
jgi:hypothetical protein